MSLWEKESLAAEAVLAAERKVRKAFFNKQFAPKNLRDHPKAANEGHLKTGQR
jgi:hypothetical protein